MVEQRSQGPAAKQKGDESRPYHIVLADDHEIFRESIKRNLATRTELAVVGEAADGRALLGLLSAGTLLPDMVIMDVSMPNLGGLDATREIKKLYPAIKILVLTVHNENEYIERAFSAGADGYLLKENASDLSTAINDIIKGGVYLPSCVARGKAVPGTQEAPTAGDARSYP